MHYQHAADLIRLLGEHGTRWAAVPDAGEEVVPATAFLEGDLLRQVILRLANNLGTARIRAVGSLWNKHYNATLLSPVLAAVARTGVGLDGSAPNVGIILSAEGLPRRLVIRGPERPMLFGPRLPSALRRSDFGQRVTSVVELYRYVLPRVLENHLAPVIERLRLVTGVSRRILWGNAGNLVADLYDKMTAEGPAMAAVAAADRAVVLDARHDLVSGERNPLFNAVRYEPLDEPGLPTTIRCRLTCCQRYVLPNMPQCYTCPLLPSSERIEVLRESLLKS